MTQADLRQRIKKAAAARGLTYTVVGRGRQHTSWRCGGTVLIVPRHRDINELTALGIFRDLEGDLGTGWWRI